MENAWEWLVVSINFLKRTRILENDLKNRLFRWATMRQTEKESYRLKTQELAGFKEGLINTILMQGGTPPMCVPAGASAHNSSWDLERGFQRRRGKKRKRTPKHARMIKNCAFAPGHAHLLASQWMNLLSQTPLSKTWWKLQEEKQFPHQIYIYVLQLLRAPFILSHKRPVWNWKSREWEFSIILEVLC